MIARTALVALLLLGACHREAAAPKVVRAWVRLPAVAGLPAAGYFTIEGGSADERLVKIESTLARRTEMHQSMKGMGAMTTMAPLADVAVPAHGQVAFAPGGRHAMLFDLDRAVAPGTAVPLRFGFASGRTAEAEAKTVGAGDDAPY
ncbi:copper chaperone PCu(A)C [Sphingomonas nostoxanthinifaciens]|uniref:copper chaperone PCu(A)C n=1 Tax=Sphingomonas nostoxanthinifaciens TaxID=2872652 RepID=UPI001CC1C34D|nr:copper chaperone PCu(A)C [Sphingomonas nostoxanthinifaciens]